MSNTVSFAGNLTEDPELAYICEGGKPYVSFRGMVDHRFQNAHGQWQGEGPTAHEVRVYGGAANSVADSFGSGAPVTVHGRLKTDKWIGKETGEKHTKRVVEVNDYLGYLGGWVNRWAAVQTEPTRRVPLCRSPCEQG